MHVGEGESGKGESGSVAAVHTLPRVPYPAAVTYCIMCMGCLTWLLFAS